MHRIPAVLLTAHPHLYTSRRLREALRAEGADVHVSAPQPWFRRAQTANAGPPLAAALLTRCGPRVLPRVLAVHRRLVRERRLRPYQGDRAIRVAADQRRTLEQLERAQIPVPRTRLVRSPSELAPAWLDIAGPGSAFVKGRRTSQGSHVVAAPDFNTARDAAGLLWGQGESALVQEDLRPRGAVRRVFVLEGRPLAAVEAIPARGEARSNWHRGGRFVGVELSAATADLALRAARALQLRLAAVDLIGDARPCVLEVNASPGLEGIETSTGQDLATPIARALLHFGSRCE